MGYENYDNELEKRISKVLEEQTTTEHFKIITNLTCFVVFGTYEPTTTSPPFLPLTIPRSLGKIGAFGVIPSRAETKLAAVRHKKRLPFNSAC